MAQSEPTANFVGTLYFARSAEVAAEVDGIVLQAYTNDGDTVKAGDRLVRLDDDLLQTEIAGTRATFEQNEIDVEQAQKDYSRFAALNEQKSVAISEFEAYGTKLNRLKKLSIRTQGPSQSATPGAEEENRARPFRRPCH